MPSPLAGAGSLLADGAFEASFLGLGNWLLPFLLACHLQAGTRFHGIGQRAENGCGWESLLGRLANGSGQGVAHLLGAPGRRFPDQAERRDRTDKGKAFPRNSHALPLGPSSLAEAASKAVLPLSSRRAATT